MIDDLRAYICTLCQRIGGDRLVQKWYTLESEDGEILICCDICVRTKFILERKGH